MCAKFDLAHMVGSEHTMCLWCTCEIWDEYVKHLLRRLYYFMLHSKC